MLNRTKSTAIIVGVLTVAAATAASVAAAGPVALPQGSEPVEIEPGDFSTRMTTPTSPWSPEIATSSARPIGETRQRVVVSVSNADEADR